MNYLPRSLGYSCSYCYDFPESGSGDLKHWLLDYETGGYFNYNSRAWRNTCGERGVYEYFYAKDVLQVRRVRGIEREAAKRMQNLRRPFACPAKLAFANASERAIQSSNK
jgi:hypothetical protein